MQKILLLLITIFSLSILHAQDEEAVFENKIYKNTLRTVRLHVSNSPLSYPVVTLNSGNSLLFYFDDVDPEVKDYVYTVQHCNQDWTPSDMSEMEYLEGFTEADIRNYDFSFRVETNFVHYQLTIPNRDISWTKSGNYILKVYEGSGVDKELVITRRFMVVETMAKVQVGINYPANVQLQRTHQEIDFDVIFQDDIVLRSPLKEVKATVLQNGRWENAITNIQPLFIRQEKLVFDYQNKIVFPGSKEWRHLDLRSLRNRSDNIYDIIQVEEGVDIVLYPDKKRTHKAYHSRIDLNGGYVVENLDRFRNLNNANNFTRTYNKKQNLESDYALVYFSLESPTEIYESDVYVFGALTDWRLSDEFKMEYSAKDQAYLTQAFLKQGYYDYMYATVKKDDPKINLEELEGNWYETKNDYTILVYYRPSGTRYDQLVSVWHTNTGQ